MFLQIGTDIALHGPYNGHLEHIFVLQNDPLNLRNEDSLQNAAKVFKLNPDRKHSSCFLNRDQETITAVHGPFIVVI